MVDRSYYRPGLTYSLKNRVEDLADEVADDDKDTRTFKDALTIVVDHLESDLANDE